MNEITTANGDEVFIAPNRIEFTIHPLTPDELDKVLNKMGAQDIPETKTYRVTWKGKKDPIGAVLNGREITWMEECGQVFTVDPKSGINPYTFGQPPYMGETGGSYNRIVDARETVGLQNEVLFRIKNPPQLA